MPPACAIPICAVHHISSKVFQYYILSALGELTLLSLSEMTETGYSLSAHAALLYYDFILTLPGEVHYIWRRSFSVVSLLFLINRYLSLLGYIPVIYFYLNAPPSADA